jgi:hypothetical protein
MPRVEAGEYLSEDAANMMRMRTMAGWLLGFCVLSLVLQAYLLTTSFYSSLWSML